MRQEVHFSHHGLFHEAAQSGRTQGFNSRISRRSPAEEVHSKTCLGVPLKILTDRGSQFTSKLLKELFRLPPH